MAAEEECRAEMAAGVVGEEVGVGVGVEQGVVWEEGVEEHLALQTGP